MKRALVALLFLVLPWSQMLACSTCFGNYQAIGGPPPANIQHMAMAIWILMFFVMSVLGGVGAFSFHLWRLGRMPVEPHQQLIDEDLSRYE
ncbi:MAG: hypothetical protein M3R59_00500 [Verrucomicrobiota bacterium]|nr:hypothetical protein [Verrucomicrobiota bacterium]